MWLYDCMLLTSILTNYQKGVYNMMEEIFQVAINAGFPAILCLLLLQYMQKNDESRHQETKDMVTAINNNTNIMSNLIDKIENFIK